MTADRSRGPSREPANRPPARGGRRAIDLADSLGVALGTLRANKLRSLLTVLGMVIGVTCIVGMTSLVRGLDRSVTGSIQSFGSTNLFLRKWVGRIVKTEAEFERLNRRPDITEADARAIQRRIPGVALVDMMYGTGPEARTRDLRYKGETVRGLFVFGTSETYLLLNDSAIADGRMFTESEVRSANRVVLIGEAVAEKLFPQVDPVGKRIQLGGFPYTVLGVLVKKDFPSFLMDEDDRVIIPHTAFRRDFGREDDSLFVIVQPETPERFRSVRDGIIALMRLRHNLPYGAESDFDVVDSATFLELWDEISNGVFLAMIVISSIGLMVGGIGVMNIMLVSVTERTREIGVRKAVGARRRDILLQFLVEAAILTALGGVGGVVLGTLLALLVSQLASFPVSIPPWSYAVGVGFSSLVGIFFGLYPANKAARLDPIEALRYE